MMTTIVPPDSFSNVNFLDSLGSFTLYASAPIVYNTSSHTVGVYTCSASSSGVVSLIDQTLGLGHKTFSDTPRCSVVPSLVNDLCNKAYVDTLAQGLTWQNEIVSFYDFTAGDPTGEVAGDRFIALTSVGAFIQWYIYQYTGTGYIQTIPIAGFACYVRSAASPLFAEEAIVFNGTTWVCLGSTIVHSSLLGLGNDDHTQYYKVAGRVGDILQINNTTASTAPANGAITVAGGAGIAANLCIGAELRVFDKTTPYTAYTRVYHNTTNTYIDCSAGSRTLNIASNFSTVAIAATTASTTPSTGALKIAGGVGIATNASIGGYIYIFDRNTPFTANTIIYHSSAFSVIDCSAASRTLDITSNFSTVAIMGTTASTLSTNGALTVAGGLGVAGAINAGSRITGANMTCSNAPSANTDVVRLSDLGSYQPRSYVCGFESLGTSSVSLVSDLTVKLTTTSTTNVWVAGSLMVIPTSTTITFVISALNYTNYIYFADTSGTLSVMTTWNDSLINQYALVMIAFTDESGDLTLLTDERKLAATNPTTRVNEHYASGTVVQSHFDSGLILGNFVIGDGSLNTHALFSVSGGAIIADDLSITIPARTVAQPMRVIYLSGGKWRPYDDDQGPFFSDGTHTYYNSFTFTAWGLTAVSNGNYILGFTFACSGLTSLSSIDCSCVGLIGRNQYTTIAAAQDAVASELRAIILGSGGSAMIPLPGFSYVCIGVSIYQCASTYANDWKCRIVQTTTLNNYIDLRYKRFNAQSFAGFNHSLIYGLTNDDHPQYFKVNGRAGEVLTVNNTSMATTSPTSGALVIADTLGTGSSQSGLGCAGNCMIGGFLGVCDQTTPYSNYSYMFLNGASTVLANHNGSQTFSFATDFTTTNIAATTASTTSTTGALTVSGGLGVAGAINVGTRITGANMTCSNAPSAATDVIRLAEFSTWTQTLIGNWTGPFTTPSAQNLRVMTIGGLCILAADAASISEPLSVATYATFSISILSRPVDDNVYAFAGIHNGGSGDLVGWLHINTTGSLLCFANSDGNWASSSVGNVYKFCVSWFFGY